MKKGLRIMLIIIVVILCVQFIWLTKIGYFAYLKEQETFFIDNDRFAYVSSIVDEEYTMTIEPDDLSIYDDEVMIENDQFKLHVTSVEIDEESNLKLYFYIDNNDNFGGGDLIYIDAIEDEQFCNNEDFEVTTNMGVANTTKCIGEGPFQPEGLYGGIYLEFDEKINWSSIDELELTFHHLMMNKYIKK